MQGESNDATKSRTGRKIRTVRVREILAKRPEIQKRLVPEIPGLYVWTRDPASWFSKDKTQTKQNLSDIVGQIGRQRTGKLSPYWKITLQEQRVPFRPRKLDILSTVLTSHNERLKQWLFDVAAQIQRPLYIGLTGDLNDRIVSRHLAQSSTLRQRLASAGVDIFDCVVSWTPLPQDCLGEACADVTEESLLRAVESLLIRLAMPLFNEQQE